MKIEIKKITLENYKCFQNKVVEFFHRTEISGKNRAGKSTLMNSYLETITGKEGDGSQPDSVRPHDKYGTEIPKVDVIRELELEIDGKPVTIRKRTFQKWRKPRGKTEEVFDGNGIDYEIDGFSYKPQKFNEYISQIANPDVLLMCSNATPFLSTLQKSTAEARKILEKLAGFSVESFISENPQYDTIADITKGHSVEDTMKKLRKQLSDQKKKVDHKNTEIKYERTRDNDSAQIELSDLELAKGEWQEKLSELDVQEKSLDEAIKAYDDLNSEIRELKIQKTTYENQSYVELHSKRKEIEDKIRPLNQKNHEHSNVIQDLQLELHSVENDIVRYQNGIKQAREDYKECLEREFDETTLHEIEAEQFDEASLICPTCGQPYPEDKQSEKRSLFETGKKKRIHDEMLKKHRFEEEIDAKLAEITEVGNKASENLKEAQAKRTETETKVAKIQQEIQTVSEEIERLSAELAKLPQEIDLSGNAEYQSLLNQISKKETALSSLNNGSEQRSTLRQQRNEYLAEISKIDGQIQKQIADAEEKERRIAELESELRNMSQIAADLECQIDTVSEFSRAKNEALAELINPHFHHFQFSFLEYTQEGNPVETCRMLVNGTDYMNGLNHGDRILTECDLVAGLQELNGINLPIFIDDSESLDPERLPEVEQQLIVLKRTDGDLKVREMA